jgi:predicted amidohydrolase
MFNTGFTMDAEHLGEPENLTTFKWMNQVAKQRQSVIVGSFIVKVAGQFFNRLYWVEPTGNYNYYDKRHLFRMGDEHLTYTPGASFIIQNIKGWNIKPLICYDLRFPVWSRNRINAKTKLPEFDLLIYVANWPAARTDVWDTLLKARALENQCYCAGINRIGSDGMNVEYNGHSTMYDFKGEPMNRIAETEEIYSVEIHLNRLKEFRMKFPAYLDNDPFTIH